MAKFNPLDHPICFSYPLRLAATPELAHVSFAMSLVDLLRPFTIVESGTTEGILYCALCQAVRELKLDAHCYGISNHDLGRDKESAPTDIFSAWKDAHDVLYSGFSQLLLRPPGGALDLFHQGSVDLLLLHSDKSYESIKRELEDWLPKLSNKGVVLLSETNFHQGALGIRKLWEELKQDHPHFEFGHGRGLGIATIGTNIPEELRRLLTTREPEISLVREFFRQQGLRLKLSSNGVHESSGNGDAPKIMERERQLLLAGLAAKTKEVDERKKAFDSALAELQATQRVLGTTEDTLTETREELDETSSELETTSSRLEAILQSRAWQWVTRYGRIKNWLLGRSQRRMLPTLSPYGRDLEVGIDTRIPEQIVVGKGSAIYISGWCYHADHKVKHAHLVFNGNQHPMKAFGMPREDVLDDQFPDPDSYGRSYRSGFWAIIALPEIEEPTAAPLVLHVTLDNKTTCEKPLATLKLIPGSESPQQVCLPEFKTIGDEPLVAICMTTYDPPIDLFVRQIESIINQTYTNWLCVISDDNSRPEILEQIKTICSRDNRFHVFPGSARLGFYHNFERSISLAPKEAEFIGLSDQDDYWHPDKLQTLLSKFDEKTTLVYSDMNIVDENGTQIATTYWTTRPNNYRNFASLLMANTVTGAASLFHRRLLPYLLPFPEKTGSPYHDHWIACTALALGKINYVDRPLYDYVQHSGNALGHYAPKRRNLRQKVRGATLALMYIRNWLRVSLANWKTVYFYDLIREQLMCKVLELRCREHLTSDKKRSLSLITRVDESLLAFAWMATRGLKDGGRRRETLGAEQVFLLATVWKKYTDFRLWFGDGVVESRRSFAALPQASTIETAANLAVKPPPLVQTFTQVQFTQQKIAPLALKLSATAASRINLLIPNIDLKHFFGGYITKLNLARRLAEAGFNVRMIIVDICDYLPSVWRRQLQSYDGLERLFDKVETVYAYDRSKLLEVSADDVFLATTWWTAHIAHEAAKALKKSNFIYLIQEYEPFTFPMGTFASLAHQTYSFPHYAIFSTELLRDYFRKNEIGVFAGAGNGEKNSISFQNCITSVGEVRLEDIAGRSPKKLLFYARPEAHAARNMFEMATLALSGAIRSGYFEGEWEFYGIGTVGTIAKVELSDGVQMTLFPRQSQETYRDILRQHDLGLSLMYTPHPSLVPIEMAAAGMLVVTNTFANKTSDKLNAISSNIIAAEPTIEDVRLKLKEAAANIADYHRRVKGSKVSWSTNWHESFNEAFMDRVEDFVSTVRHDT